MDYNKLKSFAIIAEQGTVTAAAKLLRRSQSALTQQVQLLESELSLKLFERKNGRVYLSKDGEELYALAKQHLEEIDAGYLRIKKQMGAIEGHIRLGALNDGGNDFDVGKAVGAFCAKYPQVSFTLSHGTSDGLEAALIENKLDLAIFVVFKAPEMFVQVPIVNSTHSVYSSRKYLETKGKIDTYEKLVAADLVDISEEFLGLKTFVNKNAKNFVPALSHRRPNIIAPNLYSAKDVLKEGFGVAILPDHLVADAVEDGTLVKLFPKAKGLYARLDVAYRTNHTLRMCEDLFIKSIKL